MGETMNESQNKLVIDQSQKTNGAGHIETAIVVGATGGTGAAITAELIKRGIHTIAFGRSPQKLEKLAGEMCNPAHLTLAVGDAFSPQDIKGRCYRRHLSVRKKANGKGDGGASETATHQERKNPIGIRADAVSQSLEQRADDDCPVAGLLWTNCESSFLFGLDTGSDHGRKTGLFSSGAWSFLVNMCTCRMQQRWL